jgi:hypothetical protein
LWERVSLCSPGWCVLPHLAKVCPILYLGYTYARKYSLFIWDSDLTRCSVFYVTTLVVSQWWCLLFSFYIVFAEVFKRPWGRCLWLTPIILGTWEAEIRRSKVWGQPGQKVHEIPCLQNNQSKIDWRCDSSGRAPALQVWRPAFKPQSHQNKN